MTPAATYEGPVLGQIDLLVLQPTPFCNIDCDYCYLPNRSMTKRLSITLLERIIESVAASGLMGDRLSIVWHAGEPLTLPIGYYEEAFSLINTKLTGLTKVIHSIQTNATLINDRWCDFFKAHTVNIGVSIDGPAFIHDGHRKARDGKGTHERAMRGVECLNTHGVSFHVIAVVTADSLNYPDEIFTFFLKNKVTHLGFNVEELEGIHQLSTLTGRVTEGRVKKFFKRIYELQKECGGELRVREFYRAYRAIGSGLDVPLDAIVRKNHQVLPFGIINIDCEGNVCTFSPELLGAKSIRYGNFVFGNILDNGALTEILDNPTFVSVANDVAAGVRRCAEECQYFRFCGGGAPSNKCFENGTFASTETDYCRNIIQAPLEIVLAELEHELGITQSTGVIENSERHEAYGAGGLVPLT